MLGQKSLPEDKIAQEIGAALLPGLCANSDCPHILFQFRNLKPAQKARIILDQPFFWFLALEWLIKLEFCPKYKLKYPKQLKDATYPQGCLLIQYMRLVQQVYFLSSIEEMEVYRHPAPFFKGVYSDLMNMAIQAAINPPRLDLDEKARRKKAITDIERKRLHIIRKFENPFPRTPKTRHLVFLIDTAIHFAERMEPFNRMYWNPYWRAYSRWVSEIESPRWSLPIIQGDKYYVQDGKGRKKRFITNLTQYEEIIEASLSGSPIPVSLRVPLHEQK